MQGPKLRVSQAARKLVDWENLLALRQHWHEQGLTVVWTNGCFDLLHVGHLHSLQWARALGDVLVVGVNSDDSVRQFKGDTRPIVPAAERAELLAGLECVTNVVIFSERTPELALARLQPDVHCKGSEYRPPHGKPIPELDVVTAYGGRVEFLPLIGSLSTTSLVERVRQLLAREHATAGAKP